VVTMFVNKPLAIHVGGGEGLHSLCLNFWRQAK
jgi:hypothetical protein